MFIGLYEFIYNFHGKLSQIEIDNYSEFIKTKTTLLFSILTGTVVLATIAYNLIIFENIQKQNRLQAFEKKFYHRLKIADTINQLRKVDKRIATMLNFFNFRIS